MHMKFFIFVIHGSTCTHTLKILFKNEQPLLVKGIILASSSVLTTFSCNKIILFAQYCSAVILDSWTDLYSLAF